MSYPTMLGGAEAFQPAAAVLAVIRASDDADPDRARQWLAEELIEEIDGHDTGCNGWWAETRARLSDVDLDEQTIVLGGAAWHATWGPVRRVTLVRKVDLEIERAGVTQVGTEHQALAPYGQGLGITFYVINKRARWLLRWFGVKGEDVSLISQSEATAVSLSGLIPRRQAGRS